MPAIKVADFAFPRMEAPDLDQMEEFLTHFGLIRAERTPDALYMRGADDHHHLHVTHKGGTKFIEGGQQLGMDLAQRGEMHRRGKDVVGGLAHVDVVVGMGLVPGQLGDHLVRVHVR